MDRKETPDILGQILGGPPPDQSAAPIAVAAPTRPTARRAAAPKKDVGGSKWEYLTISFQDQQGWRGRYADGEELDNWDKGPLIHELFDALGEAGWELFTVTTKDRLYGRADAIQAFFKRIK